MKFVIDMKNNQCWFGCLERIKPGFHEEMCSRTMRVCRGDLSDRPDFCPLEKLVSIPTKIENLPFVLKE